MTADQMPLIAVDGGGTGCRVAVGTAQAGILAQANGGPANVNTRFDESIRNILAASREAWSKAGLQDTPLNHATVHLGLAGADLIALQERTAQNLPFGTIRVSGDRQTMVRGVLGAADGFVLAPGTGTIVARQHHGTVRTVSGWGFAISDVGSGAWLGRSLLARVLDAEDDIEAHSDFTREIATAMGGVQEVFDFSTTALPADYARYAPRVTQAGSNGDSYATALLQQGAAYLQRGLDALGFAKGAPLCLAGGVGPHYAPYLGARYTQNLVTAKGNALEGAFALARQLAAGAD